MVNQLRFNNEQSKLLSLFSFCNSVANIKQNLVIASKLQYICIMGIVRKTKSVKLILEAVGSSDHAMSVVDLVRRFEKEMNKTTVYRILERLEEESILHSFTGQNGLKWVAKHQEPYSVDKSEIHPHFQCQKCGKSVCLDINISIPTLPNYRVDSANLILTGQCQLCDS